MNKPAGINSQRTPYQLEGTMEYAVEVYFKSRGVKEPVRVIHRLDKGTSGVMFFPKGGRPATHISYLLKTGGVEKIYWALIAADPDEEEWTVDAPDCQAEQVQVRSGPSRQGGENLLSGYCPR